MKICIVGGIFDKPESYRATITSTPETILVDGLRTRGHDVATRGHLSVDDLDGFDVIHVHHLAPGAVAAAISRNDAALVYSSHAVADPALRRQVVEPFVVRRVDAVVALSEAEARWRSRRNRGLAGRQHVIPNGIDPATFAHVPPRTDLGPPWRLLFVGQLAPFKGLTYLLRALAVLRETHPVELRLIHHIDDQLAELRKLCVELDLHNVTFAGAMAPRQLAGEYARADVFVLPSVHYEALPSVVSEAVLVGRPVVASRIAGIPEQVEDFGVLVPPGSVPELVGALQTVFAEYPRLAARSAAASRRARSRFSIEAMVARHEELYRSVAGRAPRRHRVVYLPGDIAVGRMLRRRYGAPVSAGL